VAVPWSAFLVQAAARVPHRWSQWHSGLNQRQRAMVLYAIWAAVILLFFSFSTRQEYYAVPALPALALLIGAWLHQEEDSSADSALRRGGRIGSALLAALAFVVFVAAMFLLAQSKSTPADSDLADLLKKNPTEYALAFGHIFDLTPRASDSSAFLWPHLPSRSWWAAFSTCCTGDVILLLPPTGC